MRSLFLTLFAFIFAVHAFSQYNIPQNNVWVFGHGTGLNFNSGAPVPFSTSINTNEGCASVSDVTGSLLFYTDGRTVWNKIDSIMPNGDTLVNYITISATQGALIAPVMGNPNRYYVFSIENVESTETTKCRLSYSIVDMTLDGGFGGVVAASKGTLIANDMSEKMILVPGPCSMWLLTAKLNSNEFLAYEITAAGISASPVVSAVGAFAGYTVGVLKVSHDRRTLVAMVHDYEALSPGGMELLDFDPATGVVSNSRVITTHLGSYGAEFSPDDSKLYTFNYDLFKAFQYDLSLPTVAAISASQYRLDPMVIAGLDYKLGPDTKLLCTGSA